MNVLIAYASARGSTQAIAHPIGERLRGRGPHARVGPMDDVDEHCLELADRPIWLFDVGSARVLGGGFERRAPTPESVARISAVAKVHDHHRFADAIARDDLSFRGRLFLRLVGGRYGDFRNRDEIEAWADTIAAEFVPRAPTSGGTT
ncbi:hypothetical protein [Embleya sp. NPDC059237]|uniref:hypothetical protein n=1 Tax=Embleya sp. NPDC059237 TaxID=3346784 RepID=UPI00369EE33B